MTRQFQINLVADVFTSDTRFLKAILNKIDIKRVFCEIERVSLDINNFCKWNDIEFIPIKTLDDVLLAKKVSDVAFSFGFGMIFSKSHIQEFEHGIWNFHPGDLPKYRGRHPLTHAFLEGEKEFVLSVHQINEKIDLGNLLTKVIVERTFEDNEDMILSKIINKIESEALWMAYSNYREGKISTIPFFQYRGNFVGGITLTNPTELTCRQIFDLMKSQVSHGGVKIASNSYKEAHFPIKLIRPFIPDLVLNCKDGEMWLKES